MIEQEKTFYIKGYVVPWYQIKEWWETLREKNVTLAKRYGDPYFDEKTCYLIALEIINESRRQLNQSPLTLQDIGEKAHEQIKQNSQLTTIDRGHTSQYFGDPSEGVDWIDSDAVLKKAIRDAEEARKKEHEERLQRAQFWKEQQDKEKNKPPPPKPKDPEPVLQWRKILNLSATFTKADVDKGFRTAAKKYHPDHGGTAKQMQDAVESREMAYLYLGVTE